MSAMHEYLIRAHQEELQRLARPTITAGKSRRSRRRLPARHTNRPGAVSTSEPATQLVHPATPAPFTLR
jgi:hypothetical protein